jgi:hypothetical protein
VHEPAPARVGREPCARSAVFVVSWIGADARDHRLARLPAGRAADREHLSLALIDNGGSRAMLKS